MKKKDKKGSIIRSIVVSIIGINLIVNGSITCGIIIAALGLYTVYFYSQQEVIE